MSLTKTIRAWSRSWMLLESVSHSMAENIKRSSLSLREKNVDGFAVADSAESACSILPKSGVNMY